MLISQKIKKILEVMNQRLPGHSEILSLSLLTVLSKQSLFLLGPSGTGKSTMIRMINSVISDSKLFEFDLKHMSNIDDLLGPAKVNHLVMNSQVRNVDGFLPSANIVYLKVSDEINPKSRSILLDLIDNNNFKNGSENIKTETLSFFLSSKEPSLKLSDNLDLFDRLVLKYEIDYISKEEDFKKLMQINKHDVKFEIDKSLFFSIKEINDNYAKIGSMKFNEDIEKFLVNFRQNLELISINNLDGEGYKYNVSDRRWEKSFFLMKASAFYNDRKIVDYNDLAVMIHTLWNEINDKLQIEKAYLDAIGKNIELNKFEYEISSVESLLNEKSRSNLVEITQPTIVIINNSEYYSYNEKDGDELFIIPKAVLDSYSSEKIENNDYEDVTIENVLDNLEYEESQVFDIKVEFNDPTKRTMNVVFTDSYNDETEVEVVQNNTMFKVPNKTYSQEIVDDLKKLVTHLNEISTKIKTKKNEIVGKDNIFLERSVSILHEVIFEPLNSRIAKNLNLLEVKIAEEKIKKLTSRSSK